VDLAALNEMHPIERNLHNLRERICRSCETARRDPASVTLVAVGKTFPADDIRRAYDLGVRDFGESRLQEAQPKIESLPTDIVWHFVGNLQSNKAKRAAQLFQVLHTVYKPSQLAELAKADRTVDALVEVNIAEEPQKAGLSAERLDHFVPMLLQCPQVRFRGLMTIGPVVQEPSQMRRYFRSLREANERLGGEWLSMGMSSDFEVAIQEGSTHVRVGTALFGVR
jgi:PLP dependent protein